MDALTLIACLICSGFYIDARAVIADNGVEHHEVSRSDFRIERDGLTETGGSEARSATHEARNPYGCIAVGYRRLFTTRLLAYADGSHCSSLTTGRDRGSNQISFGLTFFPFGGAQ